MSNSKPWARSIPRATASTLLLSQVLCKLLEGEPPAKTHSPREMEGEPCQASPSTAEEEENEEATGVVACGAAVGVVVGDDGQGDGVVGGSGTCEDGDEGASPSGPSGASDDERKGDDEVENERPEKSCFNVLLGMLTIATMVDAGGDTALCRVGLEENEENGRVSPGANIRHVFDFSRWAKLA